jgi:hypothetical protein
MCARFHCLPSQLYREDAELLRMLALEELMNPEEEVDDGEWQ